MIVCLRLNRKNRINRSYSGWEYKAEILLSWAAGTTVDSSPSPSILLYLFLTLLIALLLQILFGCFWQERDKRGTASERRSSNILSTKVKLVFFCSNTKHNECSVIVRNSCENFPMFKEHFFGRGFFFIFNYQTSSFLSVLNEQFCSF